MNKLEIPDNALTEAVKSADKHVGQTYDNLTQPVAKSTGMGVGSIVDLVFSPFRYLNEKSNMFFEHKLKVYKKELEEKEKSIPADKKIEPDFHSVSMALDNSKFCITNDELRKMFVNLIGNTMNTDKKDIAHPAFSEIIKQMTIEDAVIIESFKNEYSQPIVRVKRKYDDGSFITIFDKYFNSKVNNFSFIADLISISNLERLGILDITFERQFDNKDLYSDYVKEFEEMEKELSNKRGEEIKCDIEKGIVYLTQVGEAFIKACME